MSVERLAVVCRACRWAGVRRYRHTAYVTSPAWARGGTGHTVLARDEACPGCGATHTFAWSPGPCAPLPGRLDRLRAAWRRLA
jgi:hypothetical protein